MFKFVLPMFLILLSGGLFFFYIDSNYEEAKELKTEKIQYDDALNKSKELREIRDSLLSKYNTFDLEDIDKLEKMIPDNVDNVRLIMEIDALASKYGAIIRRVDVVSPAGEGELLGRDVKDYNEINLGLTIEASYEDFLKFLNDLSKSLRIMDIDSLSFNATNLSLYQFKLNFKTYWLK